MYRYCQLYNQTSIVPNSYCFYSLVVNDHYGHQVGDSVLIEILHFLVQTDECTEILDLVRQNMI